MTVRASFNTIFGPTVRHALGTSLPWKQIHESEVAKFWEECFPDEDMLLGGTWIEMVVNKLVRNFLLQG